MTGVEQTSISWKEWSKKEIGTSWPIIKACIASQGTVAVLVSENENYYVKLYDVNGKELASGEFSENRRTYLLI